jgi:hypothetical protein
MSPGTHAGFSLVELVLVLGLIGLLGGLAGASLNLGAPTLAAVQGELRAGVEQAFLLARARGCRVRVALGDAGRGQAPDRPGSRKDCGAVPPLILPPGVRWGMPRPGVPFPPRMKETHRAHLTGEAHPCITVSPAGTAQASVWFLTDGRDVVCLRLGDEGQITLLRWRQRLRRWTRG